MTFRDGNLQVQMGAALGGAIRIIAGTLYVSYATFINNRAASPDGSLGGAIGGSFFDSNSNLILSNLTVVGNFAQAAAITTGGSIEIRDSIVRQNTGGGIDSGLDMYIERCIVSDNISDNTGASGVGAGRHLTVIDSTISNNTRGGVSGGDSLSTKTIERSLISGNSRNPSAGGILSSGTTTIRDSQITNNTAPNRGGGVLSIGGNFRLSNSSVSGNGNTGSGFEDGGGGIFARGGRLFVTNSTVSGNTAVGNPGAGGGIFALKPAGVYLVNSTISNNTSSGAGGGVRIDTNAEGTFSNTIVAGNISTGTSEEELSGTIFSNGINLIGNTFGSSGWIASDLLNINPMLGPLADNGGGTMTHALLPGSPAINAGSNSTAIDPQTQMPLTVDQRGFLRFYGIVDIGAVEVQPVITGTVIYGNATGSPTPRFVSGVLLSAVGSPNLTATSRSDGTYTLGGFGSGAYTVTPSKTGGVNGVSSFDAGLIAKHVAGIQVLTGNQLIVADVSGNGTLSSFDSGQIARYTAGLSGFGSSANWIFLPVNRTYSSVTSSISGEDFIALLMGDVSGNWVPPQSRNAGLPATELPLPLGNGHR